MLVITATQYRSRKWNCGQWWYGVSFTCSHCFNNFWPHFSHISNWSKYRGLDLAYDAIYDCGCMQGRQSMHFLSQQDWQLFLREYTVLLRSFCLCMFYADTVLLRSFCLCMLYSDTVLLSFCLCMLQTLLTSADSNQFWWFQSYFQVTGMSEN